ncbi:glycerol-3-phosphate 1-O-acyltransferase PlsY [Roseobacter sp. HKCCD9010]|nr:glycerol-3-phosphate 1-O-acyltransferase PlsY [Rhodobacterales bacterium HKCCD4356]NNV10700.1 glycerol-3-phosphate 1-O-acyltransferase PlsY [Roseobacter sp. HKCCD7357]NNV14885.1 glycerol-3-phosphate 1-O-acyltransferase PlsY [Roseobacter sp. HKCCD8768]NNV24344.1 glycerol-3-phosphate 1-O-acyltransferase PlsY [Roseobacter sp. HKCCD8192]NNV28601.1 glycerol-3-phosphate 1-O-acyltransferase PlsY [Roseobacter sp. HKCCD9061]NNV32874.1 glycerol-3-phosphate 1-O-acyltransferase PlsY [Roseobacter sp. HK
MPAIETAGATLALVAIAAYLLGSVPFGLVIARLFGLGDIRQIGSGNIGATNVLRTGNKLAAFLTLILDAGKGGIAVLLARALFADDAAQIAGFMAFLGHCFPVFLGFKGGKGVATFLGTLLALFWPAGIAACLTWLVTAAISRISSLSALVAAVLTPVWMTLLGMPEASIVTVALAALILVRHQKNIERIRDGSEPRIGK